jgi:hypothetical protein
VLEQRFETLEKSTRSDIDSRLSSKTFYKTKRFWKIHTIKKIYLESAEHVQHEQSQHLDKGCAMRIGSLIQHKVSEMMYVGLG